MNEIKQLQIDNQKKTVPSYYYALVFERLKDGVWKLHFADIHLKNHQYMSWWCSNLITSIPIAHLCPEGTNLKDLIDQISMIK